MHLLEHLVGADVDAVGLGPLLLAAIALGLGRLRRIGGHCITSCVKMRMRAEWFMQLVLLLRLGCQ